MHGRKRAEYKAKMRDPTVAAKLQHKASQWYKLSAGLLQQKKQQNDNNNNNALPSLELTSNLLLVNPDPLYIWNYRRELLISQQEQQQQQQQQQENQRDPTTTVMDVVLEKEWTLTQSCLERNPKAYSVWFHRKWCVLQTLSSTSSSSLSDTTTTNDNDKKTKNESLLKHELALTKLFLERDERNFHCWNYRRFLVGCLIHNHNSEDDDKINQAVMDWDGDKPLFGNQVGVSGNSEINATKSLLVVGGGDGTQVLQSEFDFTTAKIQQNFSNGSAVHYRSKLFPFLYAAAAAAKEQQQQQQRQDEFLENELELIHNAVFTEPDDQTPWWYLEFLLPYLTETQLQEEATLLQELIEVENGKTKWGLLGLYRVYHYLSNKNDDNNQQQQQQQQQQDIINQLIELDPDRKNRYESMRKSIA